MKKLLFIIGLLISILAFGQDKTIDDLPLTTAATDSNKFILWQSASTKGYYFCDLRDDIWKDLDFKRNGSGITENFWIGYDAGSGYSAGEGNVAFGGYTMTNLNGAYYNSALSPFTLTNLTSGDENTAISYGAGYNLTTGSHNFFGGGYSGFTAQALSNITAVGYKSAYKENTVGNGTYFGYQAGYTSNGAAGITAVGYNSLYSQTTGDYNSAFGSAAGLNASGSRLVFVGTSAGEGGSSATSTANDNVAIGYEALYAYTTGTGNTVIGTNAGDALTEADYSVLAGMNAGGKLTTGDNNTIIGVAAGVELTTQGNCVMIGRAAGGQCTTNSRLYVDITNTEAPLIGGHFDNRRVGINRAIGSLAYTLDVGGTIACTDGLYIDTTPIIDGSGYIRPLSSPDGAAPTNSIYYSTDASKLVYKDPGGVVHDLY